MRRLMEARVEGLAWVLNHPTIQHLQRQSRLLRPHSLCSGSGIVAFSRFVSSASSFPSLISASLFYL